MGKNKELFKEISNSVIQFLETIQVEVRQDPQAANTSMDFRNLCDEFCSWVSVLPYPGNKSLYHLRRLRQISSEVYELLTKANARPFVHYLNTEKLRDKLSSYQRQIDQLLLHFTVSSVLIMHYLVWYQQLRNTIHARMIMSAVPLGRKAPLIDLPNRSDVGIPKYVY